MRLYDKATNITTVIGANKEGVELIHNNMSASKCESTYSRKYAKILANQRMFALSVNLSGRFSLRRLVFITYRLSMGLKKYIWPGLQFNDDFNVCII